MFSGLLLVGMVFHFNAFNDLKAEVESPRLGISTYVPVQGGTGTSTSPVAGDILMSFANNAYGPTALYAGAGITLATSTYRRLTVSATAGSGFDWTVAGYGVSTTTTLGFLNGFLSTASSTVHASSTFTGVMTASGGIFGNLTGTASLATALGANGANCSAGQAPLGVDASGAAEGCASVATFAYPWTTETLNGQLGNSTSTLLRLFGGATTTALSANTLAVGGTATTSINSAGTITSGSTATSTFTGGISMNDLKVTLAPTFTPLTSALILTGADGRTAEYTGVTCTNQFLRVLDALGAGTCATVGAADVSLANLTATDSTLTFSGTYNGSTARTIGVNLGATFVWTSVHDFGGGTSIEMVNGASPTVDAIGEFALDTTENEFLFATSTVAGAPAVIKPYEWKGFSHASSTQGSGTTTKPFFIAPPVGAGYFDSITCTATSSTATSAFLRVMLSDEAGNRMNDLVASTTENNIKFTVNNSFTAGEVINAGIGTTTNIGVFAGVTCWVKVIYTRN